MTRMSTTRVSLIERVSHPGDSDAWTEFVGLYEPVLVSYIRASDRCRGLDASDVDDLVQTVFIKLFRTLPQFTLDRERGRFRTFLYRVTMNAMIDYLRAARRRTSVATPIEELPGADVPNEPDGQWNEQYRRAIFERVARQVGEEIKSTNATKWSCFEEHCLKDRPAKDVADELGISIALVYKNTSRVLQTIRERCLAVYDEDLADER
jgi:RNA polymerase sigma-70 factor (ECF subfamily)